MELNGNIALIRRFPASKGRTMLGMAISLLFAIAAVAALAVINQSLRVGSARARLILAELGELDRRAPAIRPVVKMPPRPAFQPRLAAA